MFQWYRQIVDGFSKDAYFVAFGDDCATEAEAVAYLRLATICEGDVFALACRIVRARVTVTLDGLDGPAVPAQWTVPPLEVPRRRKLQAVTPDPIDSTTVTTAEAVTVGESGSDALRRSREIVVEPLEMPAAAETGRPQIEPIAGMVAGGPDSDVALDGADDPALDRAPMPSAMPDEAEAAGDELASAIVPPVDPSKPWVKLEGTGVTLFDGSRLWECQARSAAVAEKLAKQAQDLIDAGAVKFGTVTIYMATVDAPV